jgi:hypothetical protein
MSLSKRRLAANRMNARKSTGPITINGKATVSRNATRHGLLSTRLLLEDEDPSEFQALVLELQGCFNPVGCIEFAMVERIAINLWRQRRLVGAESASITLERRDPKIADALEREGDPVLGRDIEEEHLQPFDDVQLSWCKGVIDEVGKLQAITLESVERNAPLTWAQLKSDAEEDEESVEEYVGAHDGGLTGYIKQLVDWCQGDLERAENRPRLLALAAQLRQRRLVLPDEQLEVLARYQTTLDNQLYKALRALREVQEWRMKTIDASNADDAAGRDEAA